MPGILDPLIGPLFERIAQYFPTPEEKAKAQLAVMEMEQKGELEDAKQTMSAIIAEAQSADPWTSRARPSFLYVIYTMLLFGLPMGILSAFKPDAAASVAGGFKLWLAAIPDSLYTLFGVGYLGYTGSRAVEKIKGVTK
jgi:hypothetical protein